MVSLEIDGKMLEVKEGRTILEAAKEIGIEIPHLCYMNLEEIGFKNDCSSCRICVVEVEGQRRLIPSCSTPVANGMKIWTNTKRVMQKRRNIVELLLSDHPKDCLICGKNGNCELQKIAISFGIRKIRFSGRESSYEKEESVAITRDVTKCIMCRRCESICRDIQSCNILTGVRRGFSAVVDTAFSRSLQHTRCTFCGQCVSVCPTGAIYETDNSFQLFQDIMNEEKIVVMQVAPAVRVAIGEMFGMEAGTDVTGKLVSALKKIGIDYVFDTNFAADVTVMEEATELKYRMEHGKILPIFTSCCPAWVRFLQQNYPEMEKYLSSTKSPQEIFGAIAKHIFQKEQEKEVVCVSLMPCVAKKYEASIGKDVNYSVTTREIVNLLKQFNIDLSLMPEEDFDQPFATSSGGGDIFGRSGGVMEATARTLYYLLEKEDLKEVAFHNLRGFDGLKFSEVKIGEKVLRLAVVHGLRQAREVVEAIRNGQLQIDALEVMACKGGCLAGGGQPYHHGDFSIIQKRTEAIQRLDDRNSIQCSHQNEDVLRMYREKIGSIYGDEAKELFHYEKGRCYAIIHM